MFVYHELFFDVVCRGCRISEEVQELEEVFELPRHLPLVMAAAADLKPSKVPFSDLSSSSRRHPAVRRALLNAE